MRLSQWGTTRVAVATHNRREATEMEITTCKSCGKKYGYVVSDMKVPGGKEREYAYCPYCKSEGPSVLTSGWITTYKLEKVE